MLVATRCAPDETEPAVPYKLNPPLLNKELPGPIFTLPLLVSTVNTSPPSASFLTSKASVDVVSIIWLPLISNLDVGVSVPIPRFPFAINLIFSVNVFTEPYSPPPPFSV